MSNPNQAPSAWNEHPQLGAFFGVNTQEREVSFFERMKNFARCIGSAALTAPSMSSVGSSEIVQHDPTDQLVA